MNLNLIIIWKYGLLKSICDKMIRSRWIVQAILFYICYINTNLLTYAKHMLLCEWLWFFYFLTSLNVTSFFFGGWNLLILLSFFVVAVMVPKAHAQYSTVLNPNSCVLYDCGKHCFEQYKGIGRCLQKTGGLNPTYDCNCVYTCGPKHELKNFAYVINK